MQVSRLSELGPRTVWDILDDAFDMYRERWVLMCGTAAVIYVPLYGLYLAIIAGPSSNYFRAASGTPSASAVLGASGPFFGTLLLLFPLLMAGQMLQVGATSIIVRDTLTERRINSYRDAYSIVLRRFWPLLLGSLAVTLATAVGLCAFGIGALYAAIVLAFVPQVVVLEGRGVSQAFRRSQTLISSDWGRVLGQMLVVGAVTMLLQGGVAILLSGFFELIPLQGDEATKSVQEQLTNQAVSSIATLLLAPLGAIASTLLYYDFRVRREGFDLIARAEAIDYRLAPDPFGEVSSEEARQRQLRDQRRIERQARRGR